MAINTVVLSGNLGSDPELKYLQSGDAVANVSLAVTERFTAKDGTKGEETSWVRLVFWRRTAEILAEYCHKGSKIYIEGKLKERRWEDQSGQKRSILEVHVSKLELGGKNGNGGENSGRNTGGAGKGGGSVPGGSGGVPADSQPPEDIPF